MAGPKMRTYGNTGLLLLACCLVGIASGPAWAATTVYKCFDKTLGVLYTDEPCRGAVRRRCPAAGAWEGISILK